ncbi:MAG TPA: GTP 3',8-cyclase MoaA [Solirubrobacteraceae bacterium]|nr:GTP 3',8-cyclase MoaA [Solirubrobacteraceae bacterium]
MRDLLNRPLRDLRVSVTDRCNLRCRYCMPREIYGAAHEHLPREELLSFEEIARVVRVLAAHGVSKVRLTGGEPLLRRDLPRLVEMLAAIEGIDDLALTTNGLLLARQAQRLRDAGLTRVTVSLDALEDADLRAIADAPISVERVLAGIDAAAGAGLAPVKVNMVVRRGHNEHCVPAMAEHFRHTGHVLRLIEYMDVGTTNGWVLDEVVPAAEMLTAVAARWPLAALPPAREGEVAERHRYLDGAGEIGVISSISAPFCGSCTRARLSADGRVYTCLFAVQGHDLRPLLRSRSGDRALAEQIERIWGARRDRYSAERARASRPRARKVEMSYIGG